MARAPQHHAHRARAFALPLVVLLSMVATMAIAVMLERQGQQTRATVRQMRWTQDRHLERGVREIAGSWLTGASRRLNEIAKEGGHALDLNMEDGRTIRLDIEDAQGSVLSVFDGVSENELPFAQGAYDTIQLRAGDQETLDRWTRTVGPAAISAVTAPEEVLAAAASPMIGDGQASAMARDIVLAREGAADSVGTQWLRQVIAEYMTEMEDRRIMQRLLVAEPDLWRLRITVLDGRGRVGSMYEAVVHVDGREIRQRADSGAFTPLGPFLLWRRLDEAEMVAQAAGGR
ncbi:MAG: hypothetical protein NCW75_04575 [Phycisphaera sp.]|nr:MAG: hypothetical protein NCW75_04575 [Phycisphaera sp.]